MNISCVLTGGPVHKIDIGGEVVTFEDHPRCGPCPCDDDFREVDIGNNHPFWRIVDLWYKQGKRLENGMCVWDLTKPQKLKFLWRNNYELLPDDAPDSEVTHLDLGDKIIKFTGGRR